MLTVKSDQSERILEAGIMEQAVKEMITGSASFLSPVSSISQTRLSFLSFLLEDKTLAPDALMVAVRSSLEHILSHVQ